MFRRETYIALRARQEAYRLTKEIQRRPISVPPPPEPPRPALPLLAEWARPPIAYQGRPDVRPGGSEGGDAIIVALITVGCAIAVAYLFCTLLGGGH